MISATFTDEQTHRTQARAAFTQGLSAESLDEAAFLYDQARSLRTSNSFPWTNAEPFEARLEAHQAGLDDPADFPPLDSIEHLNDPGTLYAVTRALCLQNRQKDLLGLLGKLPEPVASQAVLDALHEGLPEAWMESVLDTLWPTQRDLGCGLIGLRRYAPGVDRLLASEPCAAWAWALGRLDLQDVPLALTAALTHEDPDVAQQAALALLRLGDRKCLKQHPAPSWLSMAKGLAGEDPSDDHASPEQLMGLGLWGKPNAVPALLGALRNPEWALASSRALFALTGAPLKEEVFVPDAAEEAAEEKASEPPSDEPPTPPEGDMVTRLSQDPLAWKSWWQEHSHAFSERKSYRLGKPSDAAWLAEILASGDTPHWLRTFTLEELAIRHDTHLPMEVDMPVTIQQEALKNPETTARLASQAPKEGWKTAMMRGIEWEEMRKQALSPETRKARAATEPMVKPVAKPVAQPVAQPSPEPLPDPATSPKQEGWKTAMNRGIEWEEMRKKALDPNYLKSRSAAQPVAQPVAKPAAEPLPDPATSPKQEGWKTAMMRGIEWERARKQALDPNYLKSRSAAKPAAQPVAQPAAKPAAEPAAEPLPDPATYNTKKEGWKTAMNRGIEWEEMRKKALDPNYLKSRSAAQPAEPLAQPAAEPLPDPATSNTKKEGWKTAMMRGIEWERMKKEALKKR